MDNTLNGSGKLIAHFKQKNTIFTSSVVQTDGKLVVAGYSWNGKNYDFAVARYNTNGSSDNMLSGDGIQTTDLGGDEKVQSIAVQSDGKIVLVGGNYLVRYNIDGSLDNGFSGDGRQISTFQLYVVRTQKDDKIVVGGEKGVARYNINGSLDARFNGSGKVVATFDGKDIAFQRDGKIVMGGDATIAR